jgi:hypothetical protein
MVSRKKATKKKKNRQKTPFTRGIDPFLLENVCALNDPFCPKSKGMRFVSATGNLATLTYQSRLLVTATTNTNGFVGFYIDPQFSLKLGTADIYRPLIQVGSAPGYVATGVPSVADSVLAAAYASDEFGSGRVVSAGVRWWDVAPSTSAGGNVVVMEMNGFQAFRRATNINCDETQVGSCNDIFDRRTPASWISRPCDAQAYEFVDPLEDNVAINDKRTSLLMFITGGDSETVLSIEIVINYEFTVGASSILQRYIKPASQSNKLKQAVVLSGRIEGGMKSFYTGIKDRVSLEIRNYATSFLKGAAKAAFRGLAGPIGSLAIMDVD